MTTTLKLKFLSLALLAMTTTAVHSGEVGSLQGHNRKHLPTVRFSDMSFDRNQNVVRGFFDIFYFNSEAPMDAKLHIRTGLELGRFDSVSRNYLPYNKWFNEKVYEMKQWEEFGWYVRIPASMYFNNGWYKTLAIDMIFVINDAEDHAAKMFHMDSPHSNYIRGEIPNFKTCLIEYNSSSSRSCPVKLEQVSKI